MLQSYPVNFIPDENGTVIAQCIDVPEALTYGDNEAHALAEARNALVVALSGYMDEKRDIPTPSRAEQGRKTVALPPAIAMKLSIYQAMRDRKVTQTELGKRMGVTDRQVRRILDLDHNTRLDHLERALKSLGKELVIDIREAA